MSHTLWVKLQAPTLPFKPQAQTLELSSMPTDGLQEAPNASSKDRSQVLKSPIWSWIMTRTHSSYETLGQINWPLWASGFFICKKVLQYPPHRGEKIINEIPVMQIRHSAHGKAEGKCSILVVVISLWYLPHYTTSNLNKYMSC